MTVMATIRKRCRKLMEEAVVELVAGTLAVALLPLGMVLEALDVIQHRNEAPR